MRYSFAITYCLLSIIACPKGNATEITTALLASHKGWCYSSISSKYFPGRDPADPLGKIYHYPDTIRVIFEAASSTSGNYVVQYFNEKHNYLEHWRAGAYSLFHFPNGHLAIQMIVNQSAMGHNTGFIKINQVEWDDDTQHMIWIGNNSDNLGARYEFVPCDDEDHIPRGPTLPPMKFPSGR